MKKSDGWLRLHVANICNFDCPHCHVFKLSENIHPSKIMDPQIFRKAVTTYLDSMKALGVMNVTINLYGGEPLLSRKFLFNEILRIDQEYLDLRIFWQMISNGSLLEDPDIQLFQRLREFEFHLSLDGPEEVQTKTRPMKNLKNSFQAASAALKKLAQNQIRTQLNSYLMPENVEHLPFLVDVASEFGIKKIYLDILHSQDSLDIEIYLQKYLQILAYGKSRGIQISGPWRNLKLSSTGQTHLEARRLGIDVLNNGDFFSSAFPLEKRARTPLSDLAKHLSAKSIQSRQQQYSAYFKKSCADCELAKVCQGGAISQHHYHVGTETDSYQICEFFRKFVPLAFPKLTLMQSPRVSILSQVRSQKKLLLFEKQIQTHLKILDDQFGFHPRVAFFIFETQLGMQYYANAFHFPQWTTSFAGNQNQIFQVGLRDGQHLRHELGHVYLNQMGKNIPSWLQEGICEFLANGPRITLKDFASPHRANEEWVSFCSQSDVLIFRNSQPPSANREYQKAHYLVSQMIKIFGWGNVLKIAKLSSDLGFIKSIETQLQLSLIPFLNLTLGTFIDASPHL